MMMAPLYNRIGASYAGTRRADPALTRALALELQFNSSGRYLDLACGTGNYTIALSALGGTWGGIDVSEVMLAQARSKCATVEWIRSDANSIPFSRDTFDGVICILALHHFADLESVFEEVCRTLRSGPFVIFTGLAEQMRHYWLCHYFPEMMVRSIAAMPSEEKIRTALSRSGFESITVNPFFVTNELQDLFLYSGKHRPALYLEPTVRANISSFANLVSLAEVREGLARLSADLGSGAFEEIKARYDTNSGDYALIAARADG